MRAVRRCDEAAASPGVEIMLMHQASKLLVIHHEPLIRKTAPNRRCRNSVIRNIASTSAVSSTTRAPWSI